MQTFLTTAHHCRRPMMLALIFVLFAVSNSAFAQARPSIDALLTRIADLEAMRGPVQVLANGEPIGSLMQAGNVNAGIGYMVLSPKKYIFQVVTTENITYFPEQCSDGSTAECIGDIGWFADVEYDGAGCSGNAYLGFTQQWTVHPGYLNTPEPMPYPSPSQGLVIQEYQDDDPSVRGRFYVPAGSTGQYVQVFSRRDVRGECTTYPIGNTKEVVPFFANDPTVTGVPNERFEGPITIE